MQKHLADEILEAIWVAQEQNEQAQGAKLDIQCSHDLGEFDLKECLAELERDGLIHLQADQIDFTPDGLKLARSLIRRHRLAQRLLMDVLDVSEPESEQMACEFEHILSEEVTDKVAAFLGNPTVDPNGKAIPPGETSQLFGEYVQPLTIRLQRLPVGRRARVAFMTPSFHKRFDRLSAFGLTPGSEIALHQRKPAFVVRLGETELALDPEIADEIFVRPLE